VSHDPSEIIPTSCFDAQKTFIIIINIEIYLFFSRFFDEKKIQKNSIYLKYKAFVTVYTIQ